MFGRRSAPASHAPSVEPRKRASTSAAEQAPSVISPTATRPPTRPSSPAKSTTPSKTEVVDDKIWTDGDFILVTADLVRFRIPSYYLFAASTVFRHAHDASREAPKSDTRTEASRPTTPTKTAKACNPPTPDSPPRSRPGSSNASHGSPEKRSSLKSKLAGMKEASKEKEAVKEKEYRRPSSAADDGQHGDVTPKEDKANGHPKANGKSGAQPNEDPSASDTTSTKSIHSVDSQGSLKEYTLTLTDRSFETARVVRLFLELVTTGRLADPLASGAYLGSLTQFLRKYQCTAALAALTHCVKAVAGNAALAAEVFVLGAAADNADTCTGALKQMASARGEGLWIDMKGIDYRTWESLPPQYAWALTRTAANAVRTKDIGPLNEYFKHCLKTAKYGQ